MIASAAILLAVIIILVLIIALSVMGGESDDEFRGSYWGRPGSPLRRWPRGARRDSWWWDAGSRGWYGQRRQYPWWRRWTSWGYPIAHRARRDRRPETRRETERSPLRPCPGDPTGGRRPCMRHEKGWAVEDQCRAPGRYRPAKYTWRVEDPGDGASASCYEYSP